jgi:hypothetical protein
MTEKCTHGCTWDSWASPPLSSIMTCRSSTAAAATSELNNFRLCAPWNTAFARRRILFRSFLSRTSAAHAAHLLIHRISSCANSILPDLIEFSPAHHVVREPSRSLAHQPISQLSNSILMQYCIDLVENYGSAFLSRTAP